MTRLEAIRQRVERATKWEMAESNFRVAQPGWEGPTRWGEPAMFLMGKDAVIADEFRRTDLPLLLAVVEAAQEALVVGDGLMSYHQPDAFCAELDRLRVALAPLLAEGVTDGRE